LSKAGTFVEQAKAWLGADEDSGRRVESTVDLAVDYDDGTAYETNGGNGSRGRSSRPEWAPPWWSQGEQESHMTAAPGNGHHTNGETHPEQ
ncbi:MAG: hypothetical protein ACRD0O_09775, partial [Acidimicrobiia bacterium]